MERHDSSSTSSLISATTTLIPSWSQPVYAYYDPNSTLREVTAEKREPSDTGWTLLTTHADGLFPASDRWIHAYDRRMDMDIFAFLLLNGFGNDASVTNYVGRTLIARIMKADDLTKIVELSKRAKAMEGVASTRALGSRIDEKVRKLLLRCFLAIDSECYEAALKPLLQNDTITDESEPTDLFQCNGCSAILALVIEHRLYVANCGGSSGILVKEMGDGLSPFQVSNSHELPSDPSNQAAELRQVPFRCFGDYARKTEKRMAEASQMPTADASSEPYFIGHIEVNHAVRFLLLVPPSLTKLVKHLDGDGDPNATLVAAVLEALKDHESLGSSTLVALVTMLRRLNEYLRAKLGDDAPTANTPLSIVYVNLENSLAPSDSNDEQDEAVVGALMSDGETPTSERNTHDDEDTTLRTVTSEVDWSDFYTHELRETVLAKIESLKQHYRDRNNLGSIEEGP